MARCIKVKEQQQLTSNQSITIADCMMVTLHRSKSQMLAETLFEIKLPYYQSKDMEIPVVLKVSFGRIDTA